MQVLQKIVCKGDNYTLDMEWIRITEDKSIRQLKTALNMNSNKIDKKRLLFSKDFIVKIVLYCSTKFIPNCKNARVIRILV